MGIVKTMEDVQPFKTAKAALDALALASLDVPADFGEVGEYAVKPWNGGYRASMTNKIRLMRFVTE